MNRNTKIILGATAILTGSATWLLNSNKPAVPLETVPLVDLGKYMGKWYEISAFPQRFEKGCHCTTAEYRLHPDGYVEVINSCIKNGKPEVARGKAFVSDRKTNAKLKVTF